MPVTGPRRARRALIADAVANRAGPEHSRSVVADAEGYETMDEKQSMTHGRRHFLRALGSGLALASAAPAVLAKSAPATVRQLEFHHLHTRERLATTYWTDGNYDRAALASINHLLRDFRTGEVYPIAQDLLDLLATVKAELATEAPFEVIGGYRSPKTNDMLRQRSSGVAKRSLHMQGKAIDVRIVDVPTKQLREAAADLRLGGVGYYAKSNFVHLDTGRPRFW